MTRPQPLILALDIGSTSVRARFYDATAAPMEDATHEIRREPAHDGVEDAERLRAYTEEAISRALEAAGPAAAEVGAVAMATFVGNVLGVDSEGIAATPLYSYAHSGAAPEVEILRDRVDPDETYQRTGAPLHTSYQAPRLLWARRNEPAMYRKAARWVDFGTYLYSRWFDRPDAPASYSVASWSGMLDRRRLAWYVPLVEAADVDESVLPPLSDYSVPLRGLAPEWADRWPVLADVPFFLAVGDGAGANVGTGCGVPGAVALTIGTTGAMRAIVDGGHPEMPRGLWSYRLDADYALVGGAITDGGSLLNWLHGSLRLSGERVEDAEIAAVPPDGHGLTVLPFLRGERSPGWATAATATWHGITASTTAAEMARAALEAVTYRLALISELLSQAGGSSEEIIAGGSAILALPSWLQMVADATGKHVVASPERGTTARGVTILALKALGVVKSLGELPGARGEEYLPDPAVAEIYRAGLRRHTGLYSKLIE